MFCCFCQEMLLSTFIKNSSCLRSDYLGDTLKDKKVCEQYGTFSNIDLEISKPSAVARVKYRRKIELCKKQKKCVNVR